MHIPNGLEAGPVTENRTISILPSDDMALLSCSRSGLNEQQNIQAHNYCQKGLFNAKTTITVWQTPFYIHMGIGK